MIPALSIMSAKLSQLHFIDNHTWFQPLPLIWALCWAQRGRSVRLWSPWHSGPPAPPHPCALPPGSFSKGVAEGEVDPSFGPLEAIRLSIQTDSPVWIILSEVRGRSCLSVQPGEPSVHPPQPHILQHPLCTTTCGYRAAVAQV